MLIISSLFCVCTCVCVSSPFLLCVFPRWIRHSGGTALMRREWGDASEKKRGRYKAHTEHCYYYCRETTADKCVCCTRLCLLCRLCVSFDVIIYDIRAFERRCVRRSLFYISSSSCIVPRRRCHKIHILFANSCELNQWEVCFMEMRECGKSCDMGARSCIVIKFLSSIRRFTSHQISVNFARK